MASDLYKMGRLMNLEPFAVRVKAAMLLHASTMDLTAPLTNAKNFGTWVLKNPMMEEPSMMALVAADPQVLGASTMENDVLVSVDDLPDAEITRVVEAKWAIVATKYPVAS
jgi:hypothetical protein